MGKPFESEGRYKVRITEAFIREGIDNEDANAFALVIKGETEDGYEGWYNLNYRDKEITGGKSQGKTVAEVSKETLASIGVPEGYMPAVTGAIEKGLYATFVVKYDEYYTPPKLVVKWVNPVSELIPVDKLDLEVVLARFENRVAKPATKPPANTPPPFNSSPIDDDDMPF